MQREKVNYNISYVFLEVMRISLFVCVCVYLISKYTF